MDQQNYQLTLLVDEGETGGVVMVSGAGSDQAGPPAVLPAAAVPHIALQAGPGGTQAGLSQEEQDWN